MSNSSTSEIHAFYVIGEDAQGREVLRQLLTDLPEFATEKGRESGHSTHRLPFLLVGWDSKGEIWTLINKNGVWCVL